jgi:chromosome transmission fidelity protein 4
MSEDQPVSKTDDNDFLRRIQLDLDEEDGSEHARRLVRIGSSSCWFAYGGDKGGVVQVIHDTTTTTTTPTMLKYFDDDDEIHAIAINANAAIIAVGLESGAVFFFKYTEEELSSYRGDSQAPHPFADVIISQQKSPVPGPTFEGLVRDLVFVKENVLAIATEAGMCVYDIDSNQRFLEMEASKHHDGSGIRGLAVIQEATSIKLASLGMDGRLCFWNIEEDGHYNKKFSLLVREKTKVVTKADIGVIMGCDVWDRSCRPHAMWNRRFWVLPGECYIQMRLNTRDCRECDPQITHHHTASITACLGIPDSNYLITTGRDRQVLLWKLDYKKVRDAWNQLHPLKKTKRYSRLLLLPTILLKYDDATPVQVHFIRKLWDLESAATDIQYEPSTETLYLACANGQLVCVTGRRHFMGTENSNETEEIHARGDAIETSVDHTIHSSDGRMRDDKFNLQTKQTTQIKKSTNKTSSNTKSRLQKTAKDVDNESSDDDDDGFGGPLPKTYQFVDDEAEDDDDFQQENAPKTNNITTGIDDRDTVDDDEDGSSSQENDEIDDIMPSYAVPPLAQPHLTLPEPQPAFAPSSSPLDLPRRFLCWNHIGSVILRHDQDSRNTVDIHFTDSAFRRPISFTDNQGFIIGSVGEDGGIFATDLNDEEDGEANEELLVGLSERTRQLLQRSSRRVRDPNKLTGSNIYFHRFETFAALRDKDWHLTLPSGERAMGCAVGKGWTAVMTSRRFVRLFSSGGNQGPLFWLDGEPVTMAGRSRFLAVYFHRGEPLRDGTQQIGYKLIDPTAHRVVASGPVSCISAGATLSWVGFSNDGSLMAMDSEGMVSMLVYTAGPLAETASLGASWDWVPMLDTLGLRKSSDDSFWPVTVYDGKLVCVPLKGGVKYPDAARRPVTTTLGLRLPFVRGTVAQTNAMEELSIRSNIALSQKKVMQQLSNGALEDEEFDREYMALSAQVVRPTADCVAPNCSSSVNLSLIHVSIFSK